MNGIIKTLDDMGSIRENLDTDLKTLQISEIGEGKIKVYINGNERTLENVNEAWILFFGKFDNNSEGNGNDKDN